MFVLELIGKQVMHKNMGQGTVISQNTNIIEVSFPSRTAKFQYPEAFESHLTLQATDLQQQILQELGRKKAVEDAIRQKDAEQRRTRQVETDKLRPITKKKYERLNIVFKCNYCDGGKSNKQVGYDGICSDAIIKNNIFLENRSWCTQEDCPCFQYVNHEISRAELDSYCADGQGSVCYESQMLRDWIAFAGIYHNGEKAGEPMKLKQVQTNSLCVLTTRDPGVEETDRYVFGVFLVDESYEGDDNQEGYVTTRSKFKIKLSRTEAHKILFWRYYANSKQPASARWGTGLHRYVNDTIAMQILLDIAQVKKGTSDEQLANEFFDYFAKSNHIIAANIPAPSGALMLSKK